MEDTLTCYLLIDFLDEQNIIEGKERGSKEKNTLESACKLEIILSLAADQWKWETSHNQLFRNN